MGPKSTHLLTDHPRTLQSPKRRSHTFTFYQNGLGPHCLAITNAERIMNKTTPASTTSDLSPRYAFIYPIFLVTATASLYFFTTEEDTITRSCADISAGLAATCLLLACCNSKKPSKRDRGDRADQRLIDHATGEGASHEQVAELVT